MDLDAYVAAHQGSWQRLDELSRRRSLSGAEADEILDLYQRVATHLSVIRSTAPDAGVIGYLSALLARARAKASGTRAMSLRDIATYFTRTLPAGLYRLRWWWIITMLSSFAAIGVVMWWMVSHPRIESSLASPSEIDQLVNNDFESYYSESAAGAFAFHVWTNNFWLAAVCIAFGVFCIPVVYILIDNVINVGVVGSMMISHDRGSLFFGLILPHGLLEMTCLFVSAAVGLKLFWTWVSPGARTRVQALAEEGRTALAIALGLVVLLLITGVIEAFVTPSALPTWARIGVGVAAEIGFLAYVFTLGRNAYLDGATGDLESESDRGYIAPVAA
ncbi:stage II sporulation protein M [Gordonia sp. TBRC 11910]|uniref:Stage II sporulation protein M n=1 Tax=Gordonia asplenii TaxID=2725283 RepID=A0A848L761_9ACTN|nr:stage II sporulation protein M [Gordonia asplenii]NMO03438.1 stage II sporulation protein M [Gordonia asplenii]